MAITAEQVNQLRRQTNAGMMDCKKALIEAEGDFEKAIQILRKRGQKVSAARADRETTEGIVFAQSKPDYTIGIILALSCETDFVAKNEVFQELGKKLLALALEHQPANRDALLKLVSEGHTVEEMIVEIVGKIGEKIEVTAYEMLQDDTVVPYIHTGGLLGVLIALNGSTGEEVQAAGRDVAMQVAAMNPLALDKEAIDPVLLAKEKEIAMEQAKSSGKPEAILEKIAQGKVEKFFKENTLLQQAFVKDNSLSVAQYLHTIAPNLTVTDFKRVTVSS